MASEIWSHILSAKFETIEKISSRVSLHFLHERILDQFEVQFWIRLYCRHTWMSFAYRLRCEKESVVRRIWCIHFGNLRRNVGFFYRCLFENATNTRGKLRTGCSINTHDACWFHATSVTQCICVALRYCNEKLE